MSLIANKDIFNLDQLFISVDINIDAD